ncbi:30S ribosomal protein S12 methylthiotransferase RimO [Desulfococcaceae bacterium HSG9]|nr:30S ribosomal protein S12 methylthiotransferase RimO [Desulfococcaceae bacterium HSG9]
MPKTIYIETLGCARNQVDSEMIMGQFKEAGWVLTDNPDQAETIVINTCGFIEDAINQSIDTILELARFKQKGVCRRLIVAGCLPERFRDEIIKTMPEADFFVGTGAFDKILGIAQGSVKTDGCLLPKPELAAVKTNSSERIISSAPSAYLKIAEGCNRHCSYCIIPQLRGVQRSRYIKDILAEARILIKNGVKEINLVAQDTTDYGADLNPPASLNALLDVLAPLVGENRIRILYGHPDSIDPAVIKTVAAHTNICSYFDIPVQHASPSVLKRMGRYYDTETLFNLFDTIRTHIPDAALRTTIMVGFPGETDDEFEELLSFIKKIRFDHLGVFLYSDADDLPSHRLSDHVPKKLAKSRHDHLMDAQRTISEKNNAQYIDKVFPVLIETSPEDHLYIGRTAFQAPEVDGITYIRSANLEIGSFADIKITDALEYDLVGEIT